MERTGRAPSDAVGDAEDTTQRVVALYRRVLDVSEVRAEDDFFTLGGTSLSAIDLLQLVDEEFGVRVPARTFYRATVVRELASELRTLAEGGA